KADLTAAQAAQLLGISENLLKGPLLGLAPASIAPSRTWPAERFAEVANYFLKAGEGGVVLFGSERETNVTARVKNMIRGNSVDTAGKLNLAQLGWFLSRLNFLVANDSGLMHAAAAF